MKKKINKCWSAVMLCALLLGISNANCAFADTSAQFSGGLTEFRQAVTNTSTNVKFNQSQDITNTDTSDTSLSIFNSTNFTLKGTDTNTIDLGNPESGILNVTSGKTATIDNVGSVTDHTGGFKNVAINNKGGNLTINDSVFNDSSSVVTTGGTTNLNNIYMTGASQVLYQNDALSSTITNSAFSGINNGSIINVDSGCNADLTINNSTISNNTGGYAVITANQNLNINNSTISNNNKNMYSNAIVVASQDINIIGSQILDNIAGMYILSAGQDLNIIGSQILDNTVGGYILSANQNLKVDNSLVSGNSAYSSILYGQNITISDSTISNNNEKGGYLVQGTNGITVSNSIVKDNTSCNDIFQSDNSITVSDSNFSNNTTGRLLESPEIYISNSNFNSNTTTGVIIQGRYDDPNSIINISNSKLIDNNIEWLIEGQNITVSDSILNNNTAQNFIIQGVGDVTVSNSSISNNTDTNFSIFSGQNITVSDSNVSNNTSSDFIFSGNTNNILNSIVSGNTAGMFIFNGNTNLSHSIVNDNTTTDYIFQYIFQGNTNISDSIVNNNTTTDYMISGDNIDISNSSISNNKATEGSFYSQYSSIFNGKNINISGSQIEANTSNDGNIIQSYGSDSEDSGGNINITNSLFKDNKIYDASSPTSGVLTVENTGSINSINTSYINNSTTLSNPNAGAAGGAIILKSDSTANVIADNGNSLFHGNTVNGQSNAINLTGTNNTVNLNAGNGGVVQFDDKITSSDFTNKININKNIQDSNGNNVVNNGQVILNNSITNSSVNMYNGTLSLGNENVLNGDNLSLNGGYLNLINNQTGTMALNNLAVNGNTNLGIDVNLANQTADKITSANPVTGTGKINITRLNAFGIPTSANMNIAVADANARSYTTFSGASRLETPIYNYNIAYDASSGNMNFTNAGFSNSATAPAVGAVVGNYLNQVNMVNEVFGHLDSLMFLSKADRLELKYRNRTASADGQFVFSPTLLPQENPAVWMKQFTTFENVPLKNGPNVSNVAYGMLAGADSPYKEFKNGYVGYLTAYMGYTGSHQNYDDIGVYQNGGLVGLTGTVYKGNFFTSLTFNVGASAGNNYTDFGIDNFSSLNANTAIKTGYNLELFEGKMIIQPSVMIAYSFMKTFDYTTAGGVSMTSSPVNYLQVAPGVKIIGNLKNGWQPYIGVDVVINTMNTGAFYANNIQLPLCSVDPYVQYGVGLQKQWGKRFTGFGQVMARGGGRNGVALQFGFRMALGK